MKTRSTQMNQVLFTEQATTSAPAGTGQHTNTTASSGGYRDNRRGGGRNNNNNNNGSRIQYDAKGRPIIQCRACNQWGHFARDCTKEATPQHLCRWCGPGDYEDANFPQAGVNLLNIEKAEKTGEKEVLAITRAQTKKATYPDPRTEKERLREAKANIEREMTTERRDNEVASTSSRTEAENNIIGQILQIEVPIKVKDLLDSMPQLRTAILTNVQSTALSSAP